MDCYLTGKLRSSNANLLDPPRDVNTSTYGHRSFLFAAPKLWNALPQTIRNAPTVNQFKVLSKLIFLTSISAISDSSVSYIFVCFCIVFFSSLLGAL